MTPLPISLILNAGSILLGIISWFFAGFAIVSRNSSASYKRTLLSFIFCIVSLVFQVFEISNRVTIRDFSAIEDTMNAVVIASVTLIAVTVSLNIVAFRKAKKLP